MRRRLSIRLRVTISVGVIALASLGGLAHVLSERARDEQISSLDDDLAIDARVVTQLFGQRSAGVDAPVLTDTGREVQLVDRRGVPVLPVPGDEPLLGEGPPEVGNLTRELPGLGRFRFRVREVPDAPGYHLVVGRSVEQVHDADEALRRALLVAVPAMSLAFALVAYAVVGRALRPVERMRLAAGRITADDLQERIPAPDTGDEVQRLASTLNAMLDRIEHGARRERQLIADASHELRSPLAAARALTESRPEDPAEAARHDQVVVAELVRLQALLDQLLELARHDAAEALVERPVDLDDVVLRCADRLRDAHPELQVDTSHVSAGQVRGSEDALTRVVDNLADNAARHARHTVAFHVVEEQDEVVLLVADDGPGIPPEARQRVFERFTRLDDARTRDHGGAGLGLAIVSAIVERHRGSIAVVDTDEGPGGATFEVRFPGPPG